jgi:hypothetical protein
LNAKTESTLFLLNYQHYPLPRQRAKSQKDYHPCIYARYYHFCWYLLPPSYRYRKLRRDFLRVNSNSQHLLFFCSYFLNCGYAQKLMLAALGAFQGTYCRLSRLSGTSSTTTRGESRLWFKRIISHASLSLRILKEGRANQMNFGVERAVSYPSATHANRIGYCNLDCGYVNLGMNLYT